jgi:transposase
MGRPGKYPRERRERAVRVVAELRPDYPSEYAAMTAVARMLGIGSPETSRTWIRRQQVDAGERPGVTTGVAEEIKRLKWGNAELRRANEISKAASAFFAAELDRPLKR